MKIVVLDGYMINPGDLSWEPLRRLGELCVYDRTAPEKTAERIGENDIVFTNKVQLDADIIDAAPNLKWIGVAATGYNVVDVDAAAKKRIPVCNAPGYATSAVAEMVFALLLELMHRAAAHSNAVMNGAWIKSEDFCFWIHPQTELCGLKIGIIGFGAIGRKTADIAQAFGMKVLVHTDYPNPDLQSDTLQFVSLDTLYHEADVISLHRALNAVTEKMIDAQAIAKMKDGVYLINTARGGLVDEAALRDALNSGKVAGAGCDTVSAEPMRPDNPLLSAKNIVITPHMAWASRQSRQRLMDMLALNLEAYLNGSLKNCVNMD